MGINLKMKDLVKYKDMSNEDFEKIYPLYQGINVRRVFIFKQGCFERLFIRDIDLGNSFNDIQNEIRRINMDDYRWSPQLWAYDSLKSAITHLLNSKNRLKK